MINEFAINYKPINVSGPWSSFDETWIGGVSGTLKNYPETYTATRNWFVALTPSAPPDDPDIPDIPEGAIGISTIEELQLIGNDPAYPLDGYYVLLNDIDASATATWNDGAGFAPIGSYATPFTGTLDGQGFGVTDLFINRPSENYVGLFSVAFGVLKNCYVTGAVTGSDYVGGLVGGGFFVEKCYSACTVAGNYYVGGLVGIIEGTLTNSYATGAVTGDTQVGGLVGQAYNTTLTNSYATGAVTGDTQVGGLVGNKSGGGAFGKGTTVINSYYDTQTTGQADNTGKGAPRTTAAMYQQATFVGWDFGLYWTINEGVDYPRLIWESA